MSYRNMIVVAALAAPQQSGDVTRTTFVAMKGGEGGTVREGKSV